MTKQTEPLAKFKPFTVVVYSPKATFPIWSDDRSDLFFLSGAAAICRCVLLIGLAYDDFTP